MKAKRLYKATVVEGNIETTLTYTAYNQIDVRKKCKRDMVGRQKIKEIRESQE